MYLENWNRRKKNSLHTTLFNRQGFSKRISLPKSTVISKEKIKDPRQPKYAPLRRYLPAGMTVAEINSNYKEKHPEEMVCHESYRKIFVSMKISFTKLGGEECEECEEYKQHDCLLSGHEPEA